MSNWPEYYNVVNYGMDKMLPGENYFICYLSAGELVEGVENFMLIG
jgi:hypothetical protein